METVIAPTTLRQFRSAAVRSFKRANPGLVNLQIEWYESLRVTTWANGTSGYRGAFVASADGYQRRRMLASWCNGMMVH